MKNKIYLLIFYRGRTLTVFIRTGTIKNRKHRWFSKRCRLSTLEMCAKTRRDRFWILPAVIWLLQVDKWDSRQVTKESPFRLSWGIKTNVSKFMVDVFLKNFFAMIICQQENIGDVRYKQFPLNTHPWSNCLPYIEYDFYYQFLNPEPLNQLALFLIKLMKLLFS